MKRKVQGVIYDCLGGSGVRQACKFDFFPTSLRYNHLKAWVKTTNVSDGQTPLGLIKNKFSNRKLPS